MYNIFEYLSSTYPEKEQLEAELFLSALSLKGECLHHLKYQKGWPYKTLIFNTNFPFTLRQIPPPATQSYINTKNFL